MLVRYKSSCMSVRMLITHSYCQVCALLCGGLAIVGVAVCCSTEQFKVHRLRCRQWLSDITLGHYCGSSIMLHCPTNSKKLETVVIECLTDNMFN